MRKYKSMSMDSNRKSASRNQKLDGYLGALQSARQKKSVSKAGIENNEVIIDKTTGTNPNPEKTL